MLISQETFEQVVEGIKFFFPRLAGIRGLVAKTDQSQASHKLNWTERDFDLSLDVNVKHTERFVRIISKKRIKIQEYIIESAKSYPVIFFRGGSTTDARSEVWPVRPTGAQWAQCSLSQCFPASLQEGEFSLLHSLFSVA